jgi:hypothetical protein
VQKSKGNVRTRGEIRLVHRVLEGEEDVCRVVHSLIDRQTEVSDLDVSGGVQENVGRLEIAMDNAVMEVRVNSGREGRKEEERNGLERGEM